MDVLDSTKTLSGIHYFTTMTYHVPSLGRTVRAYLLGEEHSNQNQCHREGEDIVSVLLRAVQEQAFVNASDPEAPWSLSVRSKPISELQVAIYLEMPQSFEENNMTSILCARKPTNGPRKDVLNTLRSCLLGIRNTSTHDSELRRRINFTDIREFFGNVLPYTEQEEACVDEIASTEDDMDALRALNRHFVAPIVNAIIDMPQIDETFRSLILHKAEPRMTRHEAYVYKLWHSGMMLFASNIEAHIHEVTEAMSTPVVERIVDDYRKVMDLFIDLYTTYRILRDVEEGTVDRAIFYGGSSHSIAVTQHLTAYGFETETSFKESVTTSCLRRPPTPGARNPAWAPRA
jgi:hypothetical protein